MRVFVTGAASPLGRALITLLIERGDAVVGQIRRRSGIGAVKKLGAETLLADLTDARRLATAMEGCERVFHLAHYFDFWAPTLTTFHNVNVYGCENVMNAAVSVGVQRVVLCSSSLTIGERPGEVGHESTPHRGYTRTAFERTQLAAETLALRFRVQGIEVVIANPALILAPNDPGWTGRLLASQVTGQRRYASTSPMGWVAVQDVAEGLVRAAERGRNGARYILCGDTMSQHELLTRVAKLAGKAAPKPLSPRMMVARAYVSSKVAETLKRRPKISMDEGRFTSAGFRVDGLGATMELDLMYTPMSRYLPGVVASYRTAMRHFAG